MEGWINGGMTGWLEGWMDGWMEVNDTSAQVRLLRVLKSFR